VTEPDPTTQPAEPGRAGEADEEPMDATWPVGMPYTVYFPGADATSAADLEYPAHLPRVGDLVAYIDRESQEHRYRVREVVHTLQASAVHDQGQIRAGLPKVFLEEID
jgi:hypothetical protein